MQYSLGSVRSVMFAFLLLALPRFASGTCHVIKQGGTGNNTGTDWNNALADLPASLIRGDIYFIASGNYQGHVFNDADSGATTIEIRTATAADHCTDIGWDDTFGGQVVFKSQAGSTGAILTFQKDYYIVNGVYRANTGAPQGDWRNEPSYGIRLDNSQKVACTADVIIGGGRPAYIHDLILNYVDISGSHETTATGCREDGVFSADGSYNLTFNYDYVHDTGRTIFLLRGEGANCSGTQPNVTCGSPASGRGTGDNITVKYGYFYKNFSSTNTHAEGCSCSEGLKNLTFAFNYWQDIDGSGILVPATAADWNNGNGANGPWYFYGNVVFESSCSAYSGAHEPGIDFILYTFDSTFTAPVYIVNNTIYNFPASCNISSGIMLGDANQTYITPMKQVYVENNLWAAAAQIEIENTCRTSGGQATCTSMSWDHNAYFASPDDSGSADTDASKEVSGSAAPFSNAAAFDFTLTMHTEPGINTHLLVPGNDIDLLGNSRATFDRGAFEYLSVQIVSPPTNLRAVVR